MSSEDEFFHNLENKSLKRSGCKKNYYAKKVKLVNDLAEDQ